MKECLVFWMSEITSIVLAEGSGLGLALVLSL